MCVSTTNTTKQEKLQSAYQNLKNTHYVCGHFTSSLLSRSLWYTLSWSRSVSNDVCFVHTRTFFLFHQVDVKPKRKNWTSQKFDSNWHQPCHNVRANRSATRFRQTLNHTVTCLMHPTQVSSTKPNFLYFFGRRGVDKRHRFGSVRVLNWSELRIHHLNSGPKHFHGPRPWSKGDSTKSIRLGGMHGDLVNVIYTAQKLKRNFNSKANFDLRP